MTALLELERSAAVAGWTRKALWAYVGGLSTPSKMPGYSYGLPAAECITGTKLRAVEGSTCGSCYAFERGNYRWKTTTDAQYRRLSTIGLPLWADAMAELINRLAPKHPHFRWHDSGDLQSVDHLRRICEVCERTPDVQHWIPTREYRMVADYVRAGGIVPPNLSIRMSAHMLGGRLPAFPGLPVTVSSVSRTADDYQGAHRCPAPDQGGSCGDCRACWSRDVPHVDYHIH